jgi:hypothetical protein
MLLLRLPCIFGTFSIRNEGFYSSDCREECKCSDFIQASVETNVKAKGRATQKKEQSKRAIPGETK